MVVGLLRTQKSKTEGKIHKAGGGGVDCNTSLLVTLPPTVILRPELHVPSPSTIGPKSGDY